MPSTAPTISPDHHIAVARGLIAAALDRGAGMPDEAALTLAEAWDALEDPGCLPELIEPVVGPAATPSALLRLARTTLRNSIPRAGSAEGALRLAAAIQHLDIALARLDGSVEDDRDGRL